MVHLNFLYSFLRGSPPELHVSPNKLLTYQPCFYLIGSSALNDMGRWLWMVNRQGFGIRSNSVAQEPEGSSPHSQQHATGLCPETVESNPPLPPSQSPQDPFWSHPPTYALVLRVVSFLRAFPPKPCTIFSPLPCVPHALPTSFALTWCAYLVEGRLQKLRKPICYVVWVSWTVWYCLMFEECRSFPACLGPLRIPSCTRPSPRWDDRLYVSEAAVVICNPGSVNSGDTLLQFVLLQRLFEACMDR
jgi:hypothetical protein